MIGYAGRIGPGKMAVVVGVEGAGRKTFASLYFPPIKLTEKHIRLSSEVTEVVVAALLDCCHLQNLAEKDMLDELAATIQRWDSQNVRILLVLGRADLVCTRRQNREWIEGVMCAYEPYLKKLKAKRRAIIAHSNLAVQRVRQALDAELDADDVEDINYLLQKVGHRMPHEVTADNVRAYLRSHWRTLQMLTGEFYVNRFINVDN